MLRCLLECAIHEFWGERLLERSSYGPFRMSGQACGPPRLSAPTSSKPAPTGSPEKLRPSPRPMIGPLPASDILWANVVCLASNVNSGHHCPFEASFRLVRRCWALPALPRPDADVESPREDSEPLPKVAGVGLTLRGCGGDWPRSAMGLGRHTRSRCDDQRPAP